MSPTHPAFPSRPSHRSPVSLRAVAGVLLALAGAGVLTALGIVTYGPWAACRTLALSLGLALPLVISLTGQALVIGGLWLLWSAAHRRET